MLGLCTLGAGIVLSLGILGCGILGVLILGAGIVLTLGILGCGTLGVLTFGAEICFLEIELICLLTELKSALAPILIL